MNFNNNTAPSHQKIPINCMKETLLPYKLIYSSPCDSCRKNRIKCDRDPKECAHCKRKGVKCTYLYTRKKRGPKGKLHHLMQQFETTLKSKDEEVPIAQIQTQHIVSNNVSSRSNSSISSLLNPEPYYHNQSQYGQKAMHDSAPSYSYSYYNSGNIESGRPTLIPSSSASYYEGEKRSSTFYLPSSSSSSLSHDLANYSTAPHNSRLSPSLSSRINSANQIEQNNSNGSDLHFIIPRKNSTINTYSNSLYSEFN